MNMKTLLAILLCFASVPALAQRISVTGNFTVYVAPAVNCTPGHFGTGGPAVTTCGNDNAAGTIDAPWATVQHAIDVLYSQYDFRGLYAPTIQMASGMSPFYYPLAAISGKLLGQPGSLPPLVVGPGHPSYDIGKYNPLVIQGDPSSPTGAFLLSGDFGLPGNGPALSLTDGAAVKVNGISFDTGSGDHTGVPPQDCIDVMLGSFLDLGNAVFGYCGPQSASNYNIHIGVAFGSSLFITAPIHVNGGSSAFIQAGAASSVYPNNNGESQIEITFTSGPVFNAAAFVIDNSILYEQGLSFSGCIHGSADLLVDGGVINTRHDPASC